MRRALAIVALWVLLPVNAAAQTPSASDTDAALAEVDRQYAAAEAADCTMACQALDSMRRATEHLCTLDPGDRCGKARQKLAEAAAHVHATCPACARALDEEQRKGGVREPPPSAPSPTTAETEMAVGKRGGCAGCATSGPSDGDAWPLGLTVVALLATRRRRSR